MPRLGPGQAKSFEFAKHYDQRAAEGNQAESTSTSSIMKYRTVVTLGTDELDNSSSAANHWPVAGGGELQPGACSRQSFAVSTNGSTPSLGSSGTTTVISKPSFKVISNNPQENVRIPHEAADLALSLPCGPLGPTIGTTYGPYGAGVGPGTMHSNGHYEVPTPEPGMEDDPTDFHSSPMLGAKGVRTSASTSGVSSSSSSLDNHDSGLEDGACSPVEEITHRFYLLESATKESNGALQEDHHPFFLGSRDVRDPATLQEMKIISSKGTVRGFKNRVRAGIMSFLDHHEKPGKNYKVIEKGRLILFTTSMRIVRDTYEKCMRLKNILQTHMVQYEELDVFMSRENQRDLLERLGTDKIEVPQVFADGKLLGGATQIENMNESGELRRIFQHFTKVNRPTSCEKCGGYRYIPCTACHGSKKSLHRNHFTEEFCALRCINCDENGLIRCDLCHKSESQ